MVDKEFRIVTNLGWITSLNSSKNISHKKSVDSYPRCLLGGNCRAAFSLDKGQKLKGSD